LKRRILALLLFFAFIFEAAAQKVNSGYVLNMHRSTGPIEIDGVLDEPSWLNAEVATDFYQVLPMDTGKSWARTDVRMTYDDRGIYLSAVCFDSLPGGYIVESMRRDFSFGSNDNFLVFIDPFEDQTNGFSFGANAAGAQWDGLMYDGGNVDLSWDNKWASEVKNYDDRWIFEAFIPYKTIRYKKGITEWGINFSRLDLKLNEKSSWAPVTRQFPTASLAFTGTLRWDNPPPNPGTNISLIPYASAGGFWDNEQNPAEDYNFDVGLDAKLAVTPSLNLDLTVNPDFSQVEVDRQVTNLSRFELFFPERRQFFIENSDLFANFGLESLRPFFSRRIGLDSPVRFGGRLSGKIDKNWRIGVMDVHTGALGNEGIPGQNFAVAALQRQVFSRSNISAIFINRETMGYEAGKTDSAYTRYNRMAGLEYNLASTNNVWKGKILLHKTFTPEVKSDDFTHAVDLEYSKRKFELEWTHRYVGSNYNAEVGFVPRTGYFSIRPRVRYRIFPKSQKIVSHGPVFGMENIWSKDADLTDSETFLSYRMEFLDRSSVEMWVSNDYVKLLDYFDPTNTDGELLEPGSEYQWNAIGAFYQSTQARLFTYQFETRYGGYYNGHRAYIGGELGYRFQPFGSISMDFTYNDIRLPEPYKSTSFWLLSPRLDVTFTNRIFLTTFLQYNEQADNINLNARFQWRFQPASDIFLVYTDNYLPENFHVKNRALVFKITYWYNI